MHRHGEVALWLRTPAAPAEGSGGSQYPHGCSQPPVTPGLGNPTASSGLHGPPHTLEHEQAHTHTLKLQR